MRLRIGFGNRDGRKEAEWITFALCCLMFIPAINNFLNYILQTGLSIRMSFLTPVSYIFMAAISMLVLYKYIFARRICLAAFCLIILSVTTSYLLYPEIRESIYASPVDLVYSPVNKLVFFCFPALLGTAFLTDHALLFERMRNWGKVTVVLGVFTFAFLLLYVGKKPNYMVYSYFMLLPICVCFEHAEHKRALSDKVIAILGSVCIVICGARGAVVSLALYFCVKALTGLRKRETRWWTLKVMCVILAAFALLVFYKELLLACIALCDRLGINSRFLSSLYSGELLEDSARSLLLESAVRSLANNPVGFGLFGDRYAMGTYGYPRYIYAHNVFLEIFCDFGIVGGTVITAVLLWRMATIMPVLRKKSALSLFYVLLPYGFCQLLFSSSFLENTPFFMILAMLFCVNWKNRMDTQTGDLT